MNQCNSQVNPNCIFGDSFSINCVSLLLAYKNVCLYFFILSWGATKWFKERLAAGKERVDRRH